MMRKKIVSLCMAMALCLSLLPATALAAAPENQVIYVGGVEISSTGYWTTDSDGNVTAYTSGDTPTDNYIHYDVANNTLTLHNATIKESVSMDTSTFIAGAAIGVHNQRGAAELTIQLQGQENTLSETSTGIYVYSSSDTASGKASLTITGNGSLNTIGYSNPGIMVQSNGGNATLSIENAEVTTTSSFSYGVLVQAKDSSNASLTVNGGSLTVTGSGTNFAGIQLQLGSSNYGSGTPSLNVSNSAIVKASGDTGGITSNSSTVTPSGTGIVFNNGTGTVYGDVTLKEDLTVENGQTLDIPSGASLDTNGKLTVDGGTLTQNGTVTGGVTYKVTGVSLDKNSLTLDVNESETLTATITPGNATDQNVTWSSDNTSVATVNNGVVSAVSEGTATITVTTADGSFTDTCEVTVTHVHTMTKTAAKPATCTEAGNTEYWYCSGCQKYFSDEKGETGISLADTVIPAAGHTFRGGWCAVCGARDPSYVPPANPNYRVDVTTTEGGAVTKDPAAAKAGETVTLTPAPEEGYEVGEVIVTDRFGDTVDVTANPDGTYTFTMPNGQVKVEVTFVEVQPEPLPFTDVSETDWFHDAVRYVYDNGLMDGVGDGQFAPNATTNRAMVVTILHRLAGEPDVSGDVAFTDVESGLWYTDAVLWAAQKGIVNGISETEFAPSGDLTREQLATVLYRYAESKGYDVSASADLSGYPDAGQVQDYAQPAMAWAVAEGIVEGMDGNLNPAGTATRAQIAAILMRFLAAAPTA